MVEEKALGSCALDTGSIASTELDGWDPSVTLSCADGKNCAGVPATVGAGSGVSSVVGVSTTILEKGVGVVAVSGSGTVDDAGIDSASAINAEAVGTLLSLADAYCCADTAVATAGSDGISSDGVAGSVPGESSAPGGPYRGPPNQGGPT